MSAEVRVCPACHEDDQSGFWSERCERDWEAASTRPCACGSWDHVHGARQALINSSRSDLGRSTMGLLDPHVESDRRIILSIYASEARAVMGR